MSRNCKGPPLSRFSGAIQNLQAHMNSSTGNIKKTPRIDNLGGLKNPNLNNTFDGTQKVGNFPITNLTLPPTQLKRVFVSVEPKKQPGIKFETAKFQSSPQRLTIPQVTRLTQEGYEICSSTAQFIAQDKRYINQKMENELA